MWHPKMTAFDNRMKELFDEVDINDRNETNTTLAGGAFVCYTVKQEK